MKRKECSVIIALIVKMSDNEDHVLDNLTTASVKTVTPPQGLISPPSLTENEIQVLKSGQITVLLEVRS